MNGTPSGCVSFISYGKYPSRRSTTKSRLRASSNPRNGPSSTSNPSAYRTNTLARGISSRRSPPGPVTTEPFPSPATALSCLIERSTTETSTENGSREEEGEVDAEDVDGEVDAEDVDAEDVDASVDADVDASEDRRPEGFFSPRAALARASSLFERTLRAAGGARASSSSPTQVMP